MKTPRGTTNVCTNDPWVRHARMSVNAQSIAEVYIPTTAADVSDIQAMSAETRVSQMPHTNWLISATVGMHCEKASNCNDDELRDMMAQSSKKLSRGGHWRSSTVKRHEIGGPPMAGYARYSIFT